jgi:hypothetical protein
LSDQCLAPSPSPFIVANTAATACKKSLHFWRRDKAKNDVQEVTLHLFIKRERDNECQSPQCLGQRRQVFKRSIYTVRHILVNLCRMA